MLFWGFGRAPRPGLSCIGHILPQHSQERGHSAGRQLDQCWCRRRRCHGTKVRDTPTFSHVPKTPTPCAEPPSDSQVCFLPFPALCQTVKRFLLAGLALVGSALLVVTVLGVLLALALTIWCSGRPWQGQQPPRQRCPFQIELQSVVGALALREREKQGEIGPQPLSHQ